MKGEITMRYLVAGSGGPGFASPEEAKEVLAKIIVPSLNQLINWRMGKKSLPEGSRLATGPLCLSLKQLPMTS
jgi:hypothetical protein